MFFSVKPSGTYSNQTKLYITWISTVAVSPLQKLIIVHWQVLGLRCKECAEQRDTSQITVLDNRNCHFKLVCCRETRQTAVMLTTNSTANCEQSWRFRLQVTTKLWSCQEVCLKQVTHFDHYVSKRQCSRMYVRVCGPSRIRRFVCSAKCLGPTQPVVQWEPGFFPADKATRAWS
jgi:hypothetical protein